MSSYKKEEGSGGGVGGAGCARHHGADLLRAPEKPAVGTSSSPAQVRGQLKGPAPPTSAGGLRQQPT